MRQQDPWVIGQGQGTASGEGGRVGHGTIPNKIDKLNQ
jgi:hypothetical protein